MYKKNVVLRETVSCPGTNIITKVFAKFILLNIFEQREGLEPLRYIYHFEL